MWALAVGQRGLTTPRPPLPAALSEPQPHRALAGRWELPGGKGGTGSRYWSGRRGRVCTSPVALCSLQLGHDRSRVEEYLCQSLPYLRDTQATLRKAAVRFIGEPQPPGTFIWQAGPSPRLPRGGPSKHVGLLGALLSPTALGYCPSLGSALLRGRRVCSQAGRAGAVLLGACWGAEV